MSTPSSSRPVAVARGESIPHDTSLPAVFGQQLADKPDIGQGLNLSFFPLVDVLGLAGLVQERALAAIDWRRSNAPEINLLEQDARLNGYHGFVRLETLRDQDAATARLRFAPNDCPTPDVELISSDDFDPFPVRWEAGTNSDPLDGPLSIAVDLPASPFELTLRLPSAWPAEKYREAVIGAFWPMDEIFNLIFETPARAPFTAQVAASVAALDSPIFCNHRFIAHAHYF